MPAARAAGVTPDSSPPPRDRPADSAAPAGHASRAAVIVLAPAYCGAGTLGSLLAGHPDLACTSGTGLLPLCEQAMATWRNADRRPPGPPSALAAATTRALAASLITSILAREGKRRWCETAAANPEAAAAFLGLYPATRFLCLYRACPGVIRAALDASPWGITEPVFAPFTSRYPANTVASLTAYWITHTATLLAFEREHPQACLRVRYEDLTEDGRSYERITSFLGLAATPGQATPEGHAEPELAPQDTGPPPAPPDHLIPPPLRAQANDLLKQLDYPVMAAAQTPSHPLHHSKS